MTDIQLRRRRFYLVSVCLGWLRRMAMKVWLLGAYIVCISPIMAMGLGKTAGVGGNGRIIDCIWACTRSRGERMQISHLSHRNNYGLLAWQHHC